MKKRCYPIAIAASLLVISPLAAACVDATESTATNGPGSQQGNETTLLSVAQACEEFLRISIEREDAMPEESYAGRVSFSMLIAANLWPQVEDSDLKYVLQSLSTSVNEPEMETSFALLLEICDPYWVAN